MCDGNLKELSLEIEGAKTKQDWLIGMDFDANASSAREGEKAAVESSLATSDVRPAAIGIVAGKNSRRAGWQTMRCCADIQARSAVPRLQRLRAATSACMRGDGMR